MNILETLGDIYSEPKETAKEDGGYVTSHPAISDWSSILSLSQ